MSAGPRLQAMTAGASVFPSEAVRAAEGTPRALPFPAALPGPAAGRRQQEELSSLPPTPVAPRIPGAVLVELRHSLDTEGPWARGEPHAVPLV